MGTAWANAAKATSAKERGMWRNVNIVMALNTEECNIMRQSGAAAVSAERVWSVHNCHGAYLTESHNARPLDNQAIAHQQPGKAMITSYHETSNSFRLDGSGIDVNKSHSMFEPILSPQGCRALSESSHDDRVVPPVHACRLMSVCAQMCGMFGGCERRSLQDMI